MKKTGLIILILFLVAWDGFWWVMGVPPLSPWRLETMLQNPSSRPTVLDVRTPAEYGWFHIQGATPASDLLLNMDVSALQAEKDKPVVVICMTGHRSVFVAYGLKKQGFQRVYNLTWGMLGWVITGGPVVRDNGAESGQGLR